MTTPTAETARLERLTTEDEALHGFIHMDETNSGHYYLTVREKPHPDAGTKAPEDARILQETYAYLTKDTENGSDGWIDNGINRRVSDDDGAADLAGELAQMYAQTAARLRGGAEGNPHRGEDQTDS
jgi:hypothetical protein